MWYFKDFFKVYLSRGCSVYPLLADRVVLAISLIIFFSNSFNDQISYKKNIYLGSIYVLCT